MPRGPKKHLKRLNAPSHWMLDKLGGIFVRACAGFLQPHLPAGICIGDAAICGLL